MSNYSFEVRVRDYIKLVMVLTSIEVETCVCDCLCWCMFLCSLFVSHV